MTRCAIPASTARWGVCHCQVAAWEADVTLVSGPVDLRSPVHLGDGFEQARKCSGSYHQSRAGHHCVRNGGGRITRPTTSRNRKIKEIKQVGLSIALEQTDDILGWLTGAEAGRVGQGSLQDFHGGPLCSGGIPGPKWQKAY